jgi:hypothetical protein
MTMMINSYYAIASLATLLVMNTTNPMLRQPSRVDLGKPIVCSFTIGQYVDEKTQSTDNSNRPLEWRFKGLKSENATYTSGGDTGQTFTHQHSMGNGISAIILQGNGAHLFSMWPSGMVFWTKHNAIGSSTASQQFRGRCRNV